MFSILKKIFNLFGGSSQVVSCNGNTVTASNGKVSYNGKTYKGNSIEVSNGKVTVDGVVVDKAKNSNTVIIATGNNTKSGNSQTVNIRM